jgi:signal transduction histidine kinase
LATASDLLERQRDRFPDRVRSTVDALAADVRRFRRLVEDLLELNRAEANVDQAVVEPVQLGDLVHHLAAQPDGWAVSVDVSSDVADAAVLTDGRRLDRVLTNLLENARNHGGGVTAVTIDRTDDRVRILVDDAGPGVPAADRRRIFERFYRGPAAGRRGSGSGTGLGLALVAEHVRILDGEVRVEVAPHGGARFIVELPWRTA